MQLKDYQQDVLVALSRYLDTLAGVEAEFNDYAEYQRSRGKPVTVRDFCQEAWDLLGSQGHVPAMRNLEGESVTPGHVGRKDGMGRPVPNICLKVPTGGGKTLLGAVAVERIAAEYLRKQTGLVLWIVPSDAIYSQTWKAFANREHPYRQMLERASGGRVKMLEKPDRFTRQDVETHLCVMVMMLQAGAVKEKSKDARKMFQDSGHFPSFFPEADDANANKALLREVPNLDVNEIGEEGFNLDGLSVRHSLGNVLRLVRPVVVVDEGHKAYSDTALGFLAGFNARFILELSATPNSGGKHSSNVLVSVAGTALRDEEMIKLPIELADDGGADWKHCLASAHARREALEDEARRVQNNEGRYIRPILLIRAERTGKDQRDKSTVHSEDVREYLTTNLGAKPEEIRVKSAEMDELDGVDLLAELCPVRYIITKDALREGWDCPFAYVLAVLSQTTANTAITQMVGRILRQPGARRTGVEALNQCYVFTFNQEVRGAVDSVKKGLEEEGMGDLAVFVKVTGKSAAATQRATVKRRAGLEERIFLPRVLSRHPITGEWRVFDQERDLLGRLDWGAFHFRQRKEFTPGDTGGVTRTTVKVDAKDLGTRGTMPENRHTTVEDVEPELDIPALVRLLLDVIPNPWQGVRILDEALAALRKRGFDERRIHASRLDLVKAMKDDLRGQVQEASEAEFRRMLGAGELTFRLMASNDAKLNWELAEALHLDLSPEDRELWTRAGQPVEKSLFEKVYEKELNGLEKDVALYLDGNQAVKWWHRIAVKQDWHVQGWKRERVYPDFLACLREDREGNVRFTVLETKGMHLAGNEDTEYKRRLFDLLTEHSRTALTAGELKLHLRKQDMRFELLLEQGWREALAEAVAT